MKKATKKLNNKISKIVYGDFVSEKDLVTNKFNHLRYKKSPPNNQGRQPSIPNSTRSTLDSDAAVPVIRLSDFKIDINQPSDKIIVHNRFNMALKSSLLLNNLSFDSSPPDKEKKDFSFIQGQQTIISDQVFDSVPLDKGIFAYNCLNKDTNLHLIQDNIQYDHMEPNKSMQDQDNLILHKVGPIFGQIPPDIGELSILSNNTLEKSTSANNDLNKIALTIPDQNQVLNQNITQVLDLFTPVQLNMPTDCSIADTKTNLSFNIFSQDIFDSNQSNQMPFISDSMSLDDSNSYDIDTEIMIIDEDFNP